jgi:Tfp pilus assembly protein PilF
MKNLAGKKWFPYAALAAVSSLLYFRTAFFGFTGLDDGTLITGSLGFLSRLSSIPAAFARDVFGGAGLGAYYRPLLTVSLVLDTLVGGGAPAVYHITNVLLHAAACMALYLFLRAWGRCAAASLAASLVFCAHPLLNQAVAWVPGRNDVLLAIFTLLSFAFFLKALSGERKAFAVHLALYACALFTKESAVVLPVLMSAYLFFIHPAPVTGRSPRRFVLWWSAVTAAWVAARALALGFLVSGPGSAGGVSFFANFPALVSYFGKTVLPYNLSPFPVLADLSLAPGLAALALAVLLTVRGGGSKKIKLFGLAWFFVWIIPSLLRAGDGIPPDFSEHRAYLSLAGLLLFAGELRPPEALRRVLPASAAALILLFAGITEARLGCFKDGLSFWKNAVKGSPSGLTSRTQLGALYFGLGRYAEASEQWGKALAMAPDNAALNSDMGSAAYVTGRPEEAEAYWTKALVCDPRSAQALTNMAVLWYDRKDYARAAPYVKKLRGLHRRVEPALAAAAAPYLR